MGSRRWMVLFNGVGLRGAGSVTALPVLGRGGVGGDAGAVVLNVTVTDPQAAGFVTVFPCGSAQPNASSLNYVAGATVANAVVVKVGDGGQVCLFTQSATHLIADVNGYFPVGSGLASLVPASVVGVAWWAVDGGWCVQWGWVAWCGVGDGVAGVGSWWCWWGCGCGGVERDGDGSAGCWFCDGVSVWECAAECVEFELCGWCDGGECGGGRRWVMVARCVCSRNQQPT